MEDAARRSAASPPVSELGTSCTLPVWRRSDAETDGTTAKGRPGTDVDGEEAREPA